MPDDLEPRRRARDAAQRELLAWLTALGDELERDPDALADELARLREPERTALVAKLEELLPRLARYRSRLSR